MPPAARSIWSRASLAEGLTARLNQTVVVEDKPGGNGVIGIGAVVKAKPDGYTLQMGAVGANVTPAAVQKDYPFDPLRDYVPVAMVAEWSAILVVKKDLPVNTLAEFVAYAKARPGALNFGTTGYGSFAHLVSEVFMQQTGIAMQHVQYKGGVAGDQRSARRHHRRAYDELRGRRRSGGESAAEDARGRKLAAAAVDPESADHGGGGRARASTRPPGSACSGRPACRNAIRERIAREVVAIANDPAYQAKLRNTGFEPLGLDAQATARMYRDEVTRWTAFIKERGLTEK